MTDPAVVQKVLESLGSAQTVDEVVNEQEEIIIQARFTAKANVAQALYNLTHVEGLQHIVPYEQSLLIW